jgi:hypothetical protein
MKSSAGIFWGLQIRKLFRMGGASAEQHPVGPQLGSQAQIFRDLPESSRSAVQTFKGASDQFGMLSCASPQRPCTTMSHTCPGYTLEEFCLTCEGRFEASRLGVKKRQARLALAPAASQLGILFAVLTHGLSTTWYQKRKTNERPRVLVHGNTGNLRRCTRLSTPRYARSCQTWGCTTMQGFNAWVHMVGR